MDKEQIPPLWQHQSEALARARLVDNFALFFEMGCGKTRVICELLQEKLENTLILCPPVVIEQWKNEIERYTNIEPWRVITMAGSSSKKMKEFKSMAPSKGAYILITNFETLINKGILKAFEGFTKTLVIDESTRIKNHKAARTKACIRLADLANKRYILSGSPVTGSQLDIFSQFRVLDQGRTFGKSYLIFLGEYFHNKNAAFKNTNWYFPDWQPKPGCSELIGKKIAPISMRVTKEEAMDLPELVKKEIFVELSRKEREIYESMRLNLIAFLNDKTCVAKMALTKTIRLQQIVSGFIALDDGSEKSFADFCKLKALEDLLEDLAPTNKVIIWCIYKRNYKDIGDLCVRLKLPFAELHGGTVNKEEEVRRFMEDDSCRVMIGSPQAGGLGVNLTIASHSIYYSRGFSLEADVQSEARNHRGGSLEMGHQKITRFDLIAKDSIDELVMIALKNKLTTAESILSLLKANL